MTGSGSDRLTSAQGNTGVPIGCVVLLVCFFLPWVALGNVSAMTIALDAAKADTSILYVGFTTNDPQTAGRVLLMVPLLAISTLMLELSVPTGRGNRMAVRIATAAGGGTLVAFFTMVALAGGHRLAYGFWGSLSGALFITVGGLFNVFRGE